MFVFSCYVTIATFIMAQGVISQFIEAKGNMERIKIRVHVFCCVNDDCVLELIT